MQEIYLLSRKQLGHKKSPPILDFFKKHQTAQRPPILDFLKKHQTAQRPPIWG
jgi:hypothetical protein